MSEQAKHAASICNAILRNGYEAYVLTGRQLPVPQSQLDGATAVATEMCLEDLIKIFSDLVPSTHAPLLGELKSEEGDIKFFLSELVCTSRQHEEELYEGFEDFADGVIRFSGDPDVTLKSNYLLAFRAMRVACNFHLDIDPNSWLAIVRGARRVLDYVSISDIMDEWRKVEAENMHAFVKMMFDSMLMHGIIPELAALSRLQYLPDDSSDTRTILDHTFEVMRRYPEELPYDWFGTLACAFQCVGKIYTAAVDDEGEWTYHQYHKVGAKVTRRILNRLRMDPGEVELVCHLVHHHTSFTYMLTDKGIRRFKALDEYPRLMEMARAAIKASDSTYTQFNHNQKMLERTEVPEEMLEPVLNGREIMEFTGLKPGPAVGIIREALLKAQVAGEVSSVPEAVEYVQRYKDRHKLQ